MWKSCLAVSAALICLLFALPLTMTGGSEQAGQESGEEPVTVLPPGAADSGDTVRVLCGDTVRVMTMGEYLQGVARAEMPASFAVEALCAQAVAARTYALYKMLSPGVTHPEADICTDPACCQAYRAAAEAAELWGDMAAEYEAKICTAVAATDGMVMVYGGEPVLAVFHASAAGVTRPSGAVWSGDLPYLQSVASPESASAVPEYYSRVEVTGADFRSAFQAAHPEAVFAEEPERWITDSAVDAGGYVESVTVGGVTVHGTEMRRLYGLRSAAFETEVQGGNVVFFVTGSGHGVGMSQYGANVMAAEGATWQEILLHYYTGVSIESRGT